MSTVDPLLNVQDPGTNPDDNAQKSHDTDRDGKTSQREEEISQIAQVCHAANAAWSLASQGEAKPAWAEISDEDKSISIKGVSFVLENPNVTAEDMHRNWETDMRNNGWSYGPTKDSEAKHHPALRPYAELSAEDKIKDTLFLGICRAMFSVLAPDEHNPIPGASDKGVPLTTIGYVFKESNSLYGKYTVLKNETNGEGVVESSVVGYSDTLGLVESRNDGQINEKYNVIEVYTTE